MLQRKNKKKKRWWSNIVNIKSSLLFDEKQRWIGIFYIRVIQELFFDLGGKD